MLNRLNEENVNLPSSRRQLIVNKIRKLANRGIMRDNEYHDVMRRSIENPKEQGKILPKEAVIIKAMKKLNSAERNLEIFEESLLPVNRDDIVAHFKRYTALNDKEIEESTSEMLSWAAQNNYKVTRDDLIEVASDQLHQHDLRGYSFRVDNDDGAEFVIPTAVPITPFVKLEDVTPEDTFDLRPGYMHPISTNKIKHSWFDVDRKIDGRDLKAVKRKTELTREIRTKVYKRALSKRTMANLNVENLDVDVPVRKFENKYPKSNY